MAIQVTCTNPECGKITKVKDDLAGKRIHCPGCRLKLYVPAPLVEEIAEVEEIGEAEIAPAKSKSVATKAGAPATAAGGSKKASKAAASSGEEHDPELERLWETSLMLNHHERIQVKK